MDNTIHQYQGLNFTPDLLPKFKKCFSDSFDEIVKQSPGSVVLSVFENTQDIHKTLAEFNRDVISAQNVINELAKSCSVICTIGFNTYLHVVFIVATLLSKKTLFPLNPHESEVFLVAQTKKVNADFFIFHDERLKLNLQFANPFTLQAQHDLPIQFDTHWSTDFIYINTSGSTGFSKIVCQSEMSVMSNVASLSTAHQLEIGTKIATCLPIFHVNALEFSLFCSLLNGCHLILFEETNSAKMPRKVREMHADIVSVNPHILKVFAKIPNLLSQNFHSIKYFVSAASALSTQLAQQVWIDCQKKIIQGYGLSEAVNFSCLLPPGISDFDYQDLMLQQKTPSIGTELWGNAIHILDSNSNALGPDQSGEIAITGFNVMAGYIGSEKLKDYLRTGDIGYYKLRNNKKYFFIEGRLKDVAKRMGETIPLREVDDLVAACGIDFDCIAIAFPHELSGEEIGIICSRDQLNEPEWHLFKHQILKIPFYKRPKVVLFEPQTQLRTSSGKPIRWKHIKKFQNYEKAVFSTQEIVIFFNLD